jgi:hypothetical protein
MKNLFVFLAIMAGIPVFGQGFTDSVTIGLPVQSGTVPFRFKLSQPSPVPAGGYQGMVLFAVPQDKQAQVQADFVRASVLAFASQSRLALVMVKTASDTSFAQLSQPSVLGDSIRAGLSRLAAASGRPEFQNAPLFAAGFARAHRFGLAVAASLPQRTAAYALVRPYRADAFAGTSVAGIPGLYLTGEVSGPDVRNNAAVYFSSQLQNPLLNQRSSGALVHQAVEMNASQSTLKEKTWDYIFGFFSKAAARRIPVGSNPAAGPVTLNIISENSGFLGRRMVWNSFEPGNTGTAPFGGSIAAGQGQWLFDAEHAVLWKAFHSSVFDTVIITPPATDVVPYCSGQRPSSLNAAFRIASSVVLDPNNFIRMEVSDITGNFDNPVYSGRYFGTTGTTSAIDTIQEAVIPDNFSWMTPVTGTEQRYRIRLVSTKPYYESPNLGETRVNFCGPAGGEPRVYLSTLRPFKAFYNRGDTIRATVYKNPDFPYIVGNNLRIDLSNKNYQFLDGNGQNVATTLFSGVPPFTASSTLDSFVVKMVLPDTLSYGPRYRLKPFIEGVSAQIGRQTSGNGHDITLLPNQSGGQIVIETLPVTGIGQTDASSGGNILFDGGSPVTVRGVVWSTSPAPTTALPTKTSNGAGSGQFSSPLTGLIPGTLYYIRAYATNANETRYGAELSFTTGLPDQVPVLTTTAVTAITQTEAISGGNITFGGGSEVTARGVCWSTGPLPTVDLSTKTGDGDGVGSFVSSITGLLPSTQYCVRAYATNSTGTGYGAEICFTTAGQAVQPPAVTTNNVNNIGIDSARCGGNVTFDGGAPVSGRGVCWSLTSPPTIADFKTVEPGNTGLFNSWLTGLIPGTTYFARAYATNSAGTSYGDEVSFQTLVTVRGRQGGAEQVLFYPNPAGDLSRLVLGSGMLPQNIRVVAATGQVVRLPVENGSGGIGGVVIETRNLSGGIYQLLFDLDGQTFSLRFRK